MIPYKTDDGSSHVKIFQDAAVGMPIMSAGETTDEDLEVTLRKHDGKVVHPETQKSFGLIKKSGVYFVKMRVPKHLACPKESEKPEGFHGPGAA